MTKRISESGSVDKNGRLLLPMDRINAFMAQSKGKRVIASFEVVEPGSTEAQQAYYYNYIIPTMRLAWLDLGERMTETQVDTKLLCEYPGDAKLIDGEYAIYAAELSQGQMSDFLEWLKQYAAENLNVYIDDPRTI